MLPVKKAAEARKLNEWNTEIITHKSSSTMENNNKALWSKILNIVITVLTAIATTFGVTSCMGV